MIRRGRQASNPAKSSWRYPDCEHRTTRRYSVGCQTNYAVQRQFAWPFDGGSPRGGRPAEVHTAFAVLTRQSFQTAAPCRIRSRSSSFVISGRAASAARRRRRRRSRDWAVAGRPQERRASLAAYVGSFAIGLGPVFWLLISEIFPLAIRGRGMSAPPS